MAANYHVIVLTRSRLRVDSHLSVQFMLTPFNGPQCDVPRLYWEDFRSLAKSPWRTGARRTGKKAAIGIQAASHNLHLFSFLRRWLPSCTLPFISAMGLLIFARLAQGEEDTVNCRSGINFFFRVSSHSTPAVASLVMASKVPKLPSQRSVRFQNTAGEMTNIDKADTNRLIDDA